MKSILYGIFLCFIVLNNNTLVAQNNFESIDNASKVNEELYVLTCSDYTSPSKKYTWTKSGVYFDTLRNGNSDSIIVVHLLINSNQASHIKTTSFGPYTSPSGQYNWDSSGVYVDTLFSVWGCDSLVIVDLTVVKAIEEKLIESEHKSIKIYPNPSDGIFSVEAIGYTLPLNVTVYDLTGRVELNIVLNNQIHQFDLSGCISGIYIVEISAQNTPEIRQIVIR